MKKKIGTLDLILIILAVFLLIFTAVMIWLYYRTYSIPDTLCTCVFGICGGECGIMGWIKTTKDKQQGKAETKEQEVLDPDEAMG